MKSGFFYQFVLNKTPAAAEACGLKSLRLPAKRIYAKKVLQYCCRWHYANLYIMGRLKL